MHSFVWALVLLSGLGSCRSEGERALSRELSTISQAVEKLRAAPNNEKLQPLKQLQALSCTKPVACEMQQLCVQAYRLHQRALEATSKARRALAGKDEQQATALLQVSEAHLERAKQMMDRCVARQGELTRAHLL